MNRQDNSSDEKQQAELLEAYWTSITHDPAAPVPAGLDPALTALAQRLASEGMAPHQDPDSTERVRRRLEAQAQLMARPAQRSQQTATARRMVRSTWLFRGPVGLASAAVLAVVVLGIYLFALRPQPASAQEILHKAQTAAGSPANNPVQSFELTEVTQHWLENAGAQQALATGNGEIVSQNKRWYQAPNKWRSESSEQAPGPDGQPLERVTTIEVNDGTDLWQYDSQLNQVTVQRADPHDPGQGSVSGFSRGVSDLGGLLDEANNCFDPRVTGSARVAGRDTYVVDLGRTKCRFAAGEEFSGRQVLWVDKEMFFILKHAQYSPADDNQLLTVSEVAGVQYGGVIDPSIFTFTPPAGANVVDNRPHPAPSAEAYRQLLAELARRVDFPVFAPAEAPAGLAARQPKLQRLDPATQHVILEYVPVGEVATDTYAGQNGVRVTEQRAASDIVDAWTQGMEPAQVPGAQAWLRRGVRNPDGTGTDSGVIMVRDGAMVALNSFTLTADDLLKLAAVLKAVPR